LHFRLYALRFHFVAQGQLRFPAGSAANAIRGGLGAALRKLTRPNEDAYSRLFEPARGTGPSGLADRPRPFVLRTAHLDGSVIPQGAGFEFGVNLFDLRPGGVEQLEAGFAQWAGVEAKLTHVEGAAAPIELPLDPAPEPVSRVVVRFLTPTELKGAGDEHDLPPFELLAARIRDRISTLGALYGDGPLPIDFRAFAERAARVRTGGGAVRQLIVQRRSRRTGQTHSLGGFIGEVEYSGDLTEFLSYLRVAAFTGVGRQTVWGKGEISVDWHS
jgi:hypothetical protein